MKNIVRLPQLNWLRKILLVGILVQYSLLVFASKSAVNFKNQKLNDTSVSSFIKQYLGDGNRVILLAYPKSVRRFYNTFGMEAAWVCQSNTN